ncbi:DUF1003 domain-containing protein [Mycobacterium sp. 852002-51961_SCH5331710]|uniref:DUF1003 domain-containing protein n=1 Tax=Mycobacterium sp. 852002-51961_SCH5331710 TaxID=1834105 RepID=UPI000801B01B|nr:DUF1003 domain-containing protein [Mycobacterium sp. 852002-51961_SCH5331710]OBB35163.1 hypothetical protein A5752_20190 [Mycobacterium sp. 852002-51961_SCH5331710]
MSDRSRLDTPLATRRFSFNVDPEAVGNFSERIARFLGTGRYLAWQTIIVIVWIALNLFAVGLRWDPYPFILLNLAFSTQAAYAAPLILLAQNRQENRDRVSLDEDRRRALQTKADTEYLARELAALRLAIGEVVTRDYLRRELDEMREMLAALQPQTGETGDDGEGRSEQGERRSKKPSLGS